MQRRQHERRILLSGGSHPAVCDAALARSRMVEEQLRRRQVTDPRVLEAMARVRREWFVAPELASRAYDDGPLPIGEGQTISQPYIVAATAEALELTGSESVLEVGTGSGYQAAVLSLLAARVFTVERIDRLAARARASLADIAPNVRVLCADGTLGWPEHAPFDAIAVAAGGPAPPPALLDQLVDGGRLVMPVGATQASQWLTQIERVGGDFVTTRLERVRFVPLIGAQGWPEAPAI